jgi:hypothetical protein
LNWYSSQRKQKPKREKREREADSERLEAIEKEEEGK